MIKSLYFCWQNNENVCRSYLQFARDNTLSCEQMKKGNVQSFFSQIPFFCTNKSKRLSVCSKALPKKHVFTMSAAREIMYPTTNLRVSRIAYDLPELLEIQRASFHKFLQQGIPDCIAQTAPIQVERDNIVIELILNEKDFQLIAPDETARDCILKMKTYSCKLYVKAQIVYKTVSGDILYTTKGEWVLIGYLPIMTKRGHFIINGSARVVVHQVLRSPGIYFQQIIEKDEDKRIRFYGDIIPRRGVWLRLQTTKKGKIEAKLKKGKKVSADMLQNCFKFIERCETQVLRQEQVVLSEKKLLDFSKSIPSLSEFENQTQDISKLKSAFRANSKKNLGLGKLPAISLQDAVATVLPVTAFEKFQEKSSLLSQNTEVALAQKKKESLTVEDIDISSFASAIEEKALLYTYDKLYRPNEDREREEMSKKVKNRSITKNVFLDKRFKLKRCYKNLFSTFQERNRYHLSNYGREKINTKLKIDVSSKQLTSLDIYTASNYLHKLTKGEVGVDDIDHFQNRRIRTSGELLHIQFESGIERLKKLALNKLKEIVHSKYTPKTILDTRSQSSAHTENWGKENKQVILPSREEASIQNQAIFQEENRSSTRTALSAETRQRSNIPLSGSKKRRKVDFTNLNLWNSLQNDCFSVIQSRVASITLKELLSTKALNGALRELFSSNPLSQYMDQTNPLAEITHKRRMSSLGVGGVSRESAGMAIRGIHPTHYGRICPIETPEGKNAGLVNSLALYAKINDKGFVETPYYKVTKGQVQRELGFTFFSAKRESALKIAPSDLQQSWNNVLTTDSVPVRVADNLLDLFQKIDSYQVDCIGISPVQMISVATSLIPFLEHNDANRALMGSNMQRQAVPLMIPERPIVGTGLESLVVAESGHLIQSESTGFVSYVSAKKIVIENVCSIAEKELHEKNWKKVFQIEKKFSTRQIKSKAEFQKRAQRKKDIPISPKKASFFDLNRSKTFQKVFEHNPEKNFQKDKQFALPFFSYLAPTCLGFEKKKNGTFVNNKLSWKKNSYKKNLTGLNISRRTVDIPKNTNTSALHFFPFNPAKISVQAERFQGVRNQFFAHRKKAQQNKAYKNIFLKRRHAFWSKTSKAQVRPSRNTKISFQSAWLQDAFSSPIQQLTPSVHAVNNFDRSNQDTCLTQRALVREGDWVQRGDILTDCSASDQGELAVGKNILVAYIPWEGYNFEDAIVISERLVKEQVYTSLHIERYDYNAQDVKEGNEYFTKYLPGISSQDVTHLDEFGLPQIGTFVREGDILVGKMRYSNKKPKSPYEKLLCDILGENNFSARDASLYVPKGVHATVIKNKIVTFSQEVSSLKLKKVKSPRLVHIFLGERRPIQVGDKMSGRHGNKGVVATILPRQDMPYLADGTPMDIILNPLGVPSRMNVGQVFESLLALAGTYLAQHFKLMAFDELYGVEASQSLVYLKLYQARLQSGQNWLFQVDFPGKTRLIDGRSGQCFDQWITVGKAYMLKLIHMVNEKIHARATGPYALITQQPLRGRSQKGGQRLGEMEVWALEGFGAAYTLQELLTKKSDDMIGRKEIASAILPRPISVSDVLGLPNKTQAHKLILGQPEIFKVLICELQALCLDVGVYSLTTQSFQRSFLSRVD